MQVYIIHNIKNTGYIYDIPGNSRIGFINPLIPQAHISPNRHLSYFTL